MLRGLPGSGKSTWAASHRGVTVSKDSLRTQLRSESSVRKAHAEIIRSQLDAGNDVIADDTNLRPGDEERLRALAEEADAEFVIVDLTDVPLSVCLERNAQRPDPVPVPAIMMMARILDNQEK